MAEAVIVVSVGTDHHRFDRLIGWLTEWHSHHPTVELVVQHGTSSPVPDARNRDLMPHDELMRWFDRADAVVLQGGPGGVMDARAHGVKPIVVPRDPAHGEHVDGHQLDFSAHLADRDLARVVREQDSLTALLDATVAGTMSWRMSSDTQTPAGVTAVSRLLSVPPPRARGSVLGRLRTMWGPRA